MRRVKAVPLSRRNLQSFIDRRLCSEAEAWPTFLYRAWAIVAEELEQPDVARKTVISAVAAAHACAVAVSARVQANARSRARQEVSSAISIIFNCTKRIRAPIRHALNELAQIEFREGPVNSEVMTSFFDGCAGVIKGLPSEADVVRIVNALGVSGYEIEKSKGRRIAAKPTLKLISDWESMHPSVRAIVEENLEQLVKDASIPLSARDIFSAIARSLTLGAITEVQKKSVDLLIVYVAAVAESWRQAGLHPGRAWHPEEPEHRSHFHRFLELVLIDQFDPSSRLFNRLDEIELMRNRRFLASFALEKDEREEAGIGPRNQWLISESHIRAATEHDSKKDS
jgi:hypothetical protein